MITRYVGKVKIWGVNSFDQWVVERGKQLGHKVHDALKSCEARETEFDSATQGLINAFMAMKDKL